MRSTESIENNSTNSTEKIEKSSSSNVKNELIDEDLSHEEFLNILHNLGNENSDFLGHNKNKINVLGSRHNMLFNFMGESQMSDHIIKLDYYSKKNRETTYYDITDLKDKYSIDLCSRGCDINTKCTHKREFSSEYDEMYCKEIKVITILKEYVIDLKYLFAKKKLDDSEIEVFDKIIYWMRLIFRYLTNDEREILFNRLSNEFYNLEYSYIVVINFLRKYFNKSTD